MNATGLRFAYLEQGVRDRSYCSCTASRTPHTRGTKFPLVAAKGYHAVSPFMRGYHPTAIPARDADQQTLEQDVLAWIGALGEERATVIAHDWGAAAAYGAATLAADRITKLVAVGIPHPAAIGPSVAKAWGVRHFLAFKLPGTAARFAENDFAALPGLCKRWSPGWDPSAEELAHVRECFSHRPSLDAAFGYYRALSVVPGPSMRRRIDVPTVAFCGLDDPVSSRADFQRAKKMFNEEYVVEEMPGGHFLRREPPNIFAKRLLAHL